MMAGEAEDEIPESGAVFTFGKSKFEDNVPSKFWLKNDKALQISCGDEHTALITDNGKLYMFGSNNWGQLGLGTKDTVHKPTCVKALKSEKVRLAACGRNHTLVYTGQGNMYAAGGNNEGQLGLGDCEERSTFHRLDFFNSDSRIKMLAAGSNVSAALTEDGQLFMWGDNSEGQIGLAKENSVSVPREVKVGKPVAAMSCGYYHSALVTVDGELFMFGESDNGKLGLPPKQMTNTRVPQPVRGIPGRVTQVACGGGHTVALTEDDLYSFGLGQFGQLGHGTFIFEASLPKAVEHFRKRKVIHIACGENHTAVITDNGLLYTFGDGRHGKLGHGEENFTNQFKPTLCSRFLKYTVQSVMCGGCHMLVLAVPRPKGSGDIILQEDDITENYLEKSYTELLGDSSVAGSLRRTLSARVRRRERESSPEQFGLMLRTLPPLRAGFLNSSLPVPSMSVPARLPGMDLPDAKLPNGLHSLAAPTTDKESNGADEKACRVEDLDDNNSEKDLGDTTDLLNMTHVMTMNPSDKTLTLSPVLKDKEVDHSTAEESEEEEEEDEEEEEEEEEEKEKSVEKPQPESATGEGLSRERSPKDSGIATVETVPDGVQKVSEVSGNPKIQEETNAQGDGDRGSKEDLKQKGIFGTNRKMSLFKRLSSESKKPERKEERKRDGVQENEPPVPNPSMHPGHEEPSDLNKNNTSEISRSLTLPQQRGPQKREGPSDRRSHSSTCALL